MDISFCCHQSCSKVFEKKSLHMLSCTKFCSDIMKLQKENNHNVNRIWIWKIVCATGSRFKHYSDIIISAMASQMTGVSIFCSSVCLGIDQKKHHSSVSLAFVRGNPLVTGGFPSQRASITEIVSIWLHHHESHRYSRLTHEESIYNGLKSGSGIYNYLIAINNEQYFMI